MEEKQLWQIFMQTGAVKDYLRYRDAVEAAAPPAQEGTTPDGTDGEGTDCPRTQYR